MKTTAQKARAKGVKKLTAILQDVKWLQANAQTVDVMSMDNDHLLHTMALLMNRLEDLAKIRKYTGIDVHFERTFGDGSKNIEEYLEIFHLELIRRDLVSQSRASKVDSTLDWLEDNGIIFNDTIGIRGFLKQLKEQEANEDDDELYD